MRVGPEIAQAKRLANTADPAWELPRVLGLIGLIYCFLLNVRNANIWWALGQTAVQTILIGVAGLIAIALLILLMLRSDGRESKPWSRLLRLGQLWGDLVGAELGELEPSRLANRRADRVHLGVAFGRVEDSSRLPAWRSGMGLCQVSTGSHVTGCCILASSGMTGERLGTVVISRRLWKTRNSIRLE